MAIFPDGRTDPTASSSDATQPPIKSGWRLVWSACGWCIAAFVGSGVLGFFAGVIVGVTGLKARIGPTNAAALYGTLGAVGASTVSAWVALHKGAIAGRGDVRVGIGDGAISRPMIVALICLFDIAYVTAISFGAYNAHPEALRTFISLSWWIAAPARLFAVIGAPIAEELFFRGWLWTGLRVRWGTLATASVTSGLWLALHLPDGIARTTLLLPLAIALPLARRYGGSLRAAIIVHVCNNAAGVTAPWIFLWLGWLAWP